MPLSPQETLEHRAYREAGHAVMSFLIRKGYTDKFVPLDRSLILAPFQSVTIEGPSARWDELTYSLGSLITTAQVLIAGYLAERIQYQIADTVFPPKDPAIQTAFHLTAAYGEEYGGDAITARQRDTEALQFLREMFAYVDERLHTFWLSVDLLAKHLLEMKVLSEERVFALVEQSIPEDKRLRMDTTIQERASPQSKAPTPSGKSWWQFWKK